MPGPAVILKELHRLRPAIHQATSRQRSRRRPKQIAVQQKRLATQEEVFQGGSRASQERWPLMMREKDGSIKATQAQIKRI